MRRRYTCQSLTNSESTTTEAATTGASVWQKVQVSCRHTSSVAYFRQEILKGRPSLNSFMMCLPVIRVASELLFDIATEQATESKHFRWSGASILGGQDEANVSALDDSLAYEEQIIGSKPRIGTGSTVREAVDS